MIEVTADLVRDFFVYDADRGRLIWKKASGSRVIVGRDAGKIGKVGYRVIGFGGKSHTEHRLVWLYVHGKWPEGEIDHLDRDRLNNRVENLRDVTRAINMQNVPKQRNNTSGVVGVWWHKRNQKWTAEIKLNGKKRHLGTYLTIEEAAAVRAKARAELHLHARPY